MAIYYWHNQGRLGNLLFQYAKLEELTSKEDLIICFNSEMFNTIKINRRFLKIPNLPVVGGIINVYLNRFFDFVAMKGIIGNLTPRKIKIFDIYENESREVLFKNGFLKSVFQVKGYFQYGDIEPDKVEIQECFLNEVQDKFKGISNCDCKVAVHIRLTDYKTWSVLGKKDVSIDIKWYEQCIDEIEKRLERPEFIVFTDDPDAIKKTNLRNKVKFFIGSSPAEDMIAISLCDHAIISPSTFAWWGAVKIKNKNKIIMAPKYWAGFKSKMWYPPCIKTHKFEYLDADVRE